MELVLKLAWLIVCYAGGFAVGVLLHELGHGLIALAATKQRIYVQVGQDGRMAEANLGRLHFVFRLKGTRYGWTRYDRDAESRGTQILVVLGGPLASLAACIGFALLANATPSGTYLWLTWLGLSLASFRILIVAVWPMEFRPDGPGGKVVWISDGLDIFRLLRRGND